MDHMSRHFFRRMADRWPVAMIALGMLITLVWLAVLGWLLLVLARTFLS